MQYLHAYLKWEIMGISDIHVFPMTITCLLQGTLCNTGIPCTFYGEKNCSVQLNINMNLLYLNQKSALCWIFVVPYNGLLGFQLHFSELVFIYQFITRMTVLVELTVWNHAELVISHIISKYFSNGALLKTWCLFCTYLFCVIAKCHFWIINSVIKLDLLTP